MNRLVWALSLASLVMSCSEKIVEEQPEAAIHNTENINVNEDDE